MGLRGTGSLFSQLYHLAAFARSMPRIRLEHGVLILSVDIDVGSKLVAQKNEGLDDATVNDYMTELEIARREELALPILIQLFDDLEIPVTFAVRGQLTETDGSTIKLLGRSHVKHDIGGHGYSHRTFTSLSSHEAENEIRMLSEGMKKTNIEPKSFVFPKNNIAHLSLLEKYGYKCFRGRGGFKYDGLYIEKRGRLYDVHPGFFLGWSPYSLFLNKIIDISARRKLPFHIWFHAWDLGADRSEMKKKVVRVLLPLLNHARTKEREGTLCFETMASVAMKLDEAKN